MSTLIRPGIMVSLKSTVDGGVRYQRTNLDAPPEVATAGSAVERWETTKVVEDPKEHEMATKTRSKALALIRACCSTTSFGLLCPKEREGELDAAVVEARKLVDEYNKTAKFTHVRVYSLKGEIASTDEEAARAIGEEVSSLVREMNSGIDRLDPEAIRDAAKRAQEMAAMLGPDQAEAVAGAIEQARKAARTIVKRIQKDGEAAAIVLKDVARGSLEKARIAFLDFEEQVPVEVAPKMPAVNVSRVAGLDFGDDDSASGKAVQ